MLKSRRITAAICSLATLSACFTGCSSKSSVIQDADAPADTEMSEGSDVSEASQEPALYAVFGEIRTQYNTKLDLSDYPLTPTEVPDDYIITLEAEDAEIKGDGVVYELPEASGGNFVKGINLEGDALKFTADIEYSGFYDLNFLTWGSEGRVNNVVVDGMKVGEITTTSPDFFGDTPLTNIYLEKGTHDITFTPYWGYVDIDCLTIKGSEYLITEDTYKVEPVLTNPNADEHTRMLYRFLCDIYGKYSLAGQYADEGRESREYSKLTQKTDRTFSVLGLDMMNYSLGNKAHGAQCRTVEYAYDWYQNAGGIVQLCWHWVAPVDYAKNDEENPWYSSFYKEGTTIDLDRIMSGEDEKGYQLLMDDIDNVSEELARLRDAGVPVLWRPLHEASGGWFWWGNCSAESYIKLWNAMYDRMTNEHNLTNLIWVWNGQDPAWYPGDETVDIAGWDIYAGKQVDSSQSGRFADITRNYGSKTKPVALTENGCVMDPDKVFRDNSRWLFWGTWSDPFTMKLGVIVNEEYTTMELLKKAYNHERVLTLDELPDLKNYPLD